MVFKNGYLDLKLTKKFNDVIFVLLLQVEVVILDKNDSPPEFKNIPSAYMASEDLAPGQLIATVTAEDPDTIGSITYSIQNEEPIPFALDSVSGALTLMDPLDRETIPEYKLMVRADDGIQFTDVTILIQVCFPYFMNIFFNYSIDYNLFVKLEYTNIFLLRRISIIKYKIKNY